MIRIALPWRALLLLAPLTAGPAHAADLHWGIAGELVQFDYREFDDRDRELNHEFGPLPGLRTTLRGSRDRWFARFDAALHYGTVTYDGETQAGNPVVSTTRTRLLGVAAEPGYWLAAERDWGIHLHLARRRWERDIQPTGNVQGLYERYRWSEAGAGLRHVLSRARGSAWGQAISVTGFATLDGDIFVDLSSLRGSNLEDITLELGRSVGTRLRYTATHRLKTGGLLRIEPWLAVWEFGRSPTREATSDGSRSGVFVFEPRSLSWRFGLALGVDF